MWPQLKTRFAIIIALLIGANLALWVLYQAVGDPDFLDYLILTDVFSFLGLGILGIVVVGLVTFRPKAFVRAIERDIARRNIKQIKRQGLPEGKAAIAAVATDVYAALESRPEVLAQCRNALNELEAGESRMAGGDSKGAVELFLRAHACFEAIPEAHLLQGLCKADLAAAYGNLGAFDKAIGCAQDCLAIVAGVERLRFNEAMTRMTLAIFLGYTGQREQSDREFQIAETILRALPDTARYLQLVDSNRKNVQDLANKPSAGRPSRHLATIMAWAAIILAAIILFLMTRGS